MPGLSERYRSGGLLVIRDVAEILEKYLGYQYQFITTHEINPHAISAIPVTPNSHQLFFVTWGPLITTHIKLIRKSISNARIIYYAQSFGWDIKIPPHIPIVCVSRFVMAQWALHATENFCAYIQPPLNPIFTFKNQPRDIDILIHRRKQNKYCLETLLPALQKEKHAINVLNDWIPQKEFAELLNRTKIFLYITAPHKAGFFRKLPGEGFGLPALEAIACGALVGSNLLGGVTDFLTPGENCIKLDNGDLNFDLAQIREALEKFTTNEKTAKKTAEDYRQDVIAKKWTSLLDSLSML